MRKDVLRLLALVALGAAAAPLAGGCNDVVGVDFGAMHAAGADGGSAYDAPVGMGDDGPGVLPDGGPLPEGATCAPKSCATQGFTCGTQNDGCGNAIDCGTCTTGQICKDAQCACVPKTCPELGIACGTTNDGCGGALDCGTCSGANEQCSGGKCQCAPQSCGAQSAACGTVSDGCGGTYECGTCADAGAGPNCSAGACGPNPCTPQTCGTGDCGMKSDGCGGTLSCGSCTAPQTCGGGGTANVCGCTPTTCAALGKNCGSVADGCGGSLSCGSCTAPQSCAGAGTANVCGCTPTTCAALGATCGAPADGCGGTLNCGSCTGYDTCGGGGATGTCGCTPTDCFDLICGGPNGCGGTCPHTPDCGCFVAGTAITMADGTTEPIEAVRAGEIVRAYDPSSRTFVTAPVLEAMVHDAAASADGIVVVNGTLRMTTNHPVFVDGARVRADQLQVGSGLMLHTPGLTLATPGVTLAAGVRDTVHSLELQPGGVTTYDLRVGAPGTYVAGGVVVWIKP